MRNNNTFFIAVKFDHHEFGMLIGANALSIFFCQMTVGSKSFQSIRQLYNRSFIITAKNSAFMNATDSECILQCVPWILFELLMTQLKLAVIFVNTHDHYIDMRTNFR